MNRAVVVSPIPITLSTGAPAAPGDELSDLDLGAERAAIDAGSIVVIERDPEPPADSEASDAPEPPVGDPDPPKPPQRRRRRPADKDQTS